MKEEADTQTVPMRSLMIILIIVFSFMTYIQFSSNKELIINDDPASIQELYNRTFKSEQ